MSYHMFIDDERFPPGNAKDWVICRNIDEVKWMFERKGSPIHISFDHDLGYNEPTGMDIARWIVDQDLDFRNGVKGAIELHPDFYFDVHSQNPVGARNISMLMVQYLEQRESGS